MAILRLFQLKSFNTASGMRSHVTLVSDSNTNGTMRFQYRKRYEITCDSSDGKEGYIFWEFQYRKRYERSHVTASMRLSWSLS